MKTRLRHLWETVTSGYWFVPTLMIVAAGVMAFMLLALDRRFVPEWELDWFYGGGADGAKTLLSTVASSVITVAGVVFSITIAALTQASSQFGPRLLRNFMRDTGNQVVLGTFVATFLYCLLVLRTIHGELEDGKAFVPQASVTVAVLLAAASIAVLIYFIHHVSMSLQAPAVVDSVKRDLAVAIENLPERPSQPPQARSTEVPGRDELPPDFEHAARPIASTREGYLQVVDYDRLIQLAAERDLVLRLWHRPGDYVVEGGALLWAWPAERSGDNAVNEQCNDAFMCGVHGTQEQDVEYAIRQLVEIAVRALSPGINDPFTAINCIDALGAAICHIARRTLPSPRRYDEHGKLRLVTPVSTFDGVVDTAFNQIRQHGHTHVAVIIRLLETITSCAQQFGEAGERRVLLKHAEMIFEQCKLAQLNENDRADIQRRWEAARRELGINPFARQGATSGNGSD